MKMKVSVGNSRMDKRWNLVEMELDEFRDRISTTKRTAETVEQYKKLSKAQQDDVKDVGGFVLGDHCDRDGNLTLSDLAWREGWEVFEG